MNRIPWCVLLMMINDQGRFKDTDTKSEEETIDNEQEELEFLGLA